MPSEQTAKLLNAYGRVTEHQCIRLEIQRFRDPDVLVGRFPGVYPIYWCTESGTERIYGCYDLRFYPEELELMYPGVPVIEHEPDAQQDEAA